MARKKSLHDLNLMDRFLFAEASEDTEFLETVLSIILEQDISLKDTPQAEKEQRKVLSGKQIRLDVYAIDEDDCVYDAEVQKRNENNLPKRSRYYHSMIDVNLLDSGNMDYNNLNDVVVIIIASFDFFGEGLFRYTIDKHCREIPGLPFPDGEKTIILNTAGTDPTGVSDELVSLLRFFENSSREVADASGSSRIRKLQTKVENIRNNEEIGVRYMLAWEEIEYAKRDGREEGRKEGLKEGRKEGLKEGRKEGRKEGHKEVAISMLAEGCSLYLITKTTGLTESEIRSLASEKEK